MRIAFIVVSFPAVSETFVLNQITGLIDLGHEVEIFAGSCPPLQKPDGEELNHGGTEARREKDEKRLRRFCDCLGNPRISATIQGEEDEAASGEKRPIELKGGVNEMEVNRARMDTEAELQVDRTSSLFSVPPCLRGSVSSSSVRHADVERYNLMAHTRCYNDMPANRAWRIVKAVWLALRHGHKNPSAVFRSLNVFKYGGEALSLNLFYKVVLFLSAGKCDVLYCQFGSSGNLGAMLKELGIQGKLVTMFHGSDIRRGIAEGPGIYRKLIEQGDCFLNISGYNYKHLVEFGVDERKVVSHHVGIELARYPFREGGPWPVADRKTGDTTDYTDSTDEEPGKQIRILTVARLAEEKGLEYGIRAIGELVKGESGKELNHGGTETRREKDEDEKRSRTFCDCLGNPRISATVQGEQEEVSSDEKRPIELKGGVNGAEMNRAKMNMEAELQVDRTSSLFSVPPCLRGSVSSPESKSLHYQIIGDGPLEAELKALVEDLHLTDTVEFLGSQDSGKVAEYLQNADLFLLPSIAEATPVSLMEAQAVGLPVVATRVGSVEEVVVDGRSGFLVPPGNVDALAEKLMYLIEHPDLWPAMGRAGRAHVEQHYNVKKLNAKLAELFAQLVRE